jgi:hypothetical protein
LKDSHGWIRLVQTISREKHSPLAQPVHFASVGAFVAYALPFGSRLNNNRILNLAFSSDPRNSKASSRSLVRVLLQNQGRRANTKPANGVSPGEFAPRGRRSFREKPQACRVGDRPADTHLYERPAGDATAGSSDYGLAGPERA